MRKSSRALVLATALFALLGGAAGADTTRQSQLTPLSGSGSGFVEVSPTSKDEAGVTFDVQGTVNIHGATPNADFTVLRRVDLNPNGICSGAIWLTLPGNPVLTTSAGGAGALHFEIQRGAPLVDGVSFNVIWRVVGIDGTILESDCMTVTVK